MSQINPSQDTGQMSFEQFVRDNWNRNNNSSFDDESNKFCQLFAKQNNADLSQLLKQLDFDVLKRECIITLPNGNKRGPIQDAFIPFLLKNISAEKWCYHFQNAQNHRTDLIDYIDDDKILQIYNIASNDNSTDKLPKAFYERWLPVYQNKNPDHLQPSERLDKLVQVYRNRISPELNDQAWHKVFKYIVEDPVDFYTLFNKFIRPFGLTDERYYALWLDNILRQSDDQQNQIDNFLNHYQNDPGFVQQVLNARFSKKPSLAANISDKKTRTLFQQVLQFNDPQAENNYIDTLAQNIQSKDVANLMDKDNKLDLLLLEQIIDQVQPRHLVHYPNLARLLFVAALDGKNGHYSDDSTQNNTYGNRYLDCYVKLLNKAKDSQNPQACYQAFIPSRPLNMLTGIKYITNLFNFMHHRSRSIFLYNLNNIDQYPYYYDRRRYMNAAQVVGELYKNSDTIQITFWTGTIVTALAAAAGTFALGAGVTVGLGMLTVVAAEYGLAILPAGLTLIGGVGTLGLTGINLGGIIDAALNKSPFKGILNSLTKENVSNDQKQGAIYHAVKQYLPERLRQAKEQLQQAQRGNSSERSLTIGPIKFSWLGEQTNQKPARAFDNQDLNVLISILDKLDGTSELLQGEKYQDLVNSAMNELEKFKDRKGSYSVPNMAEIEKQIKQSYPDEYNRYCEDKQNQNQANGGFKVQFNLSDNDYSCYGGSSNPASQAIYPGLQQPSAPHYRRF